MNPTGTEARASDRQEGGSHYSDMETEMQPWNVLAHWLTPEEYRGYQKGVAIAYLARERSKGGDMDIRKAVHHLQRLTEEFPSKQHTYEAVQKAFLRQAIGEIKEDPHAELRKTWREGQVWQGTPSPKIYGEGLDWNSYDRGAVPGWYADWIYRRHPEDKDAEPTTPADPHAELKAIYQPGMRWRCKGNEEPCLTWSDWYNDRVQGNPSWYIDCVYEIHPDDLPKPQPKEDGWITVPDDCMEMPEGLNVDDLISVKHRGGYESIEPIFASTIWWQAFSRHSTRVIAYKIIKTAE